VSTFRRLYTLRKEQLKLLPKHALALISRPSWSSISILFLDTYYLFKSTPASNKHFSAPKSNPSAPTITSSYTLVYYALQGPPSYTSLRTSTWVTPLQRLQLRHEKNRLGVLLDSFSPSSVPPYSHLICLPGHRFDTGSPSQTDT
jgi:hypothetical protein